MEWVRTIVCYVCAFQLFLHVLPGESYRKYVEFFGSLILLLLVVQPLAKLSGTVENFEQEVQLLGIRGELEELERNLDGMAGLRNEAIEEAFQKELIRQIEAVAGAYGLTEVTAEAAFGREEDGTPVLEEVRIRARGEQEGAEKAAAEISQVYQIPDGQVLVQLF
ncbi:MAG: stage III sporulation protein AF [Candidatus Limivivens sp.]|nr:stage III sporulation protein AF [Candidatus Limivivens sp.]